MIVQSNQMLVDYFFHVHTHINFILQIHETSIMTTTSRQYIVAHNKLTRSRYGV